MKITFHVKRQYTESLYKNQQSYFKQFRIGNGYRKTSRSYTTLEFGISHIVIVFATLQLSSDLPVISGSE